MRSPLTFKYYGGHSLFHRLDGRTKLLMLACWIATVLSVWDARGLLALLAAISLTLAAARIPWSMLRKPVLYLLLFTGIGALGTQLMVPMAASRWVPVETELWRLGPFRFMAETLFYSGVVSLRYVTIFPMAMLFILTTDPARLAGAVYRAGLGYKAAFVLHLAFRYLPTVSHEFTQIANAQRARGLRLDDPKAGLLTRLKRMTAIVIPLLFSSLDRVDLIANAMDLRAFGNQPTRTWYHEGRMQAADYAVLAVMAALLAGVVIVRFSGGLGFWLPW